MEAGVALDIHLQVSHVGKTVRGSSNGSWMRKSAELGMLVCSSKTKIILIRTP